MDDISDENSNFVFRLEPLRTIKVDRAPQWLISKLMPSQGLHVLYGAPGAGKTFVAVDAALHVAAGRDWAGFEVREPASVVYVAAEGGRAFRKRVVAARQALNLPDTTPFALITRAPRIGGPKDETRKLIDDIRKQCERPRLIVLDTLARSIRDLRESDSGDIMTFVDLAQEIADTFGALVMPVHHSGKDEQRGMRGSSALHAAADAEWYVRKDADTGDRLLVVEKMKDGAGGICLRYDLKTIELGEDEQGEAISSCVAEVSHDPVADSRSAGDFAEPPQAMRAFLGLKMLIACEGQRPPSNCSAPGEAKVISIKRAREALSATGLLPCDNVALRRAIKMLTQKNMVGADSDYIWLVNGPVESYEAANAA